MNLPDNYELLKGPSEPYLLMSKGWYVVATGHLNGFQKSFYLHADGEWRPTTFHEGQFSGYFNSKEEAIEKRQSAIC